jgi:hypothetical protein
VPHKPVISKSLSFLLKVIYPNTEYLSSSVQRRLCVLQSLWSLVFVFSCLALTCLVLSCLVVWGGVVSCRVLSLLSRLLSCLVPEIFCDMEHGLALFDVDEGPSSDGKRKVIQWSGEAWPPHKWDKDALWSAMTLEGKVVRILSMQNHACS